MMHLNEKSVCPTKMVTAAGEVFTIKMDTNKPSSLAKRLSTLNPALEHPSFDIQFDDLTYTVPDRKRGSKRLLSGLCGTFKSNQLTAIMGPSGAGKSTLLNILAGYKTSGLSGSVKLNGVDRSNLQDFRKVVCYIMQNDYLMPHLTVSEAMHGAATLKQGSQLSSKARAIVVDEILEALSLVQCRDTQCKNLSGGQRKRLSIALELSSNPPIMFLDEPTSGLDSASCFQGVSLLQSLAHGGRTVICSIHQPSARLYELFDHLYVVAEGQCIYRGEPQGLVPFLASLGLQCPPFHNPADYVIEVAVGEHGDVVPRVVNALNAKHTTESSCPERGKAVQEGGLSISKSVEDSLQSFRFPNSRFRQFLTLYKRTIICTTRDLSLFWVRLWTHLLCALLLGAVYQGIGNNASEVTNNTSCVFFSILFLVFTSMMPTITTFPMEKHVFLKEYINNWYSLSSFYWAKTLADLPFQIVFTTLYTVIIYYITSQPQELFRFSLVLGAWCLMAMVGQSVGIVFGIAMDVEKGIFMGPISCLPMLLFSGFFMKVGNLPIGIRWMADVSYIRYALQASIYALYGYDRANLECYESYCHLKTPTTLLKHLDMADVDMWTNFYILIGFFLVVRLLGLVLLKWHIYQNT